MFRLRKLMPLFVTVILAGLIILPMWAGETGKSDIAANEIATLEQLKAAFEKGGSYKLTKDMDTTEVLVGYKDLTLDLNGHKISRTNITSSTSHDPQRYVITRRNGKFILKNSAAQAGEIFAKAANDTASARAIGVSPAEDAVNVHPSIEINSGVKITAEGNSTEKRAIALMISTWCISSADKDTYSNTATAVINDGAILDGQKKSNGYALLTEGYGVSATINGGTFNGVRGAVGNQAGAEMTINGGTFNGIERCAGSWNALLTINGGTFTAANDVLRVSFDDTYPKCYEKGKIRVNGGNFNGALSIGGDLSYGDIQIYGGKFSQDPSEYAVFNADIASGVGQELYYEVYNGTKAKEITTFDELDNIGIKGGVAKLASDIQIPDNYYRVNVIKDLDLDLNGQTISKIGSTEDARFILRVKDGTLNIKNSSSKEGKIKFTAQNDTVRGCAIFVSPGTEGIIMPDAAYCHPKVVVGSGVNVSVTGGTEKSEAIQVWIDKDNASDIDRTATAVIQKGAKLSSSGRALLAEGFGTSITVEGGEITSGVQNVISNDLGAALKINGGTFVSNSRHAIYNCKATAIINGGTFETKNAEKYVLYNDADEDKYYSAQADTTMIVKGGVFTGNIENYVDPTQGTATLAISGGKYTVNPTKWLAEGCTVKPEGKYFIVATGEGPAKPILPEEDIPDNVDPNPAVDVPSESDVVKTAPVFAGNLEVKGNGMAYVEAGAAKEMVAKGLTSEKVEAVTPLPIFKATISEAGKVVAVSVNMKGREIKTADTVEELKIFKLTGDKSFEYKRIDKAADAKDGTFMLLEAFGTPATGAIKADTTYQLVMFIKDNGEYDLDKTEKVVLDPATLVKTSSDKPSPSGSGGGGCNAGFGILALLCAAPMIFRKKK